jgi:hypothetical protein
MIETAKYTQRQLAAKLGISQGKVAQRLGLLELPEAWRERLITGVITPTQARELVPWIKYPQVFEKLEELILEEGFEEDKDTVESLLADDRVDLSETIRGSVRMVSRSLDSIQGGRPAGRPAYGPCLIRRTAKNLEKLNVVKLDQVNYQGRKVGEQLRAMNLDVWEELQFAAEQRAKKKWEKERAQREAEAKQDGEADAATEGSALVSRKVGPEVEEAKRDRDREKLGELLAENVLQWTRGGVAQAVRQDPPTAFRLLILSMVSRSMPPHPSDLSAELQATGIVEPPVHIEALKGEQRLLSDLEQLDDDGVSRLIAGIGSRLIDPEFGHFAYIAPGLVWDLAKRLDVDARRDWQLVDPGEETEPARVWLESLNQNQLKLLADAWDLDLSLASGKSGLVELIIDQASDKPLPDLLPAENEQK